MKLEVFHRLTSPFLSVIKDRQVPNCWCWYLWHAFRDNRQTLLAPAQDLSLGILGSFSSPWRRGGGKGIPTSCQRATQAARARSLELILTPIHRKQPRRVTTCSLWLRYELFFSLIQSRKELFRHNQKYNFSIFRNKFDQPKRSVDPRVLCNTAHMICWLTAILKLWFDKAVSCTGEGGMQIRRETHKWESKTFVSR